MFKYIVKDEGRAFDDANIKPWGYYMHTNDYY